MSLNEGRKAGRSAFLLPLQQDGNPAGEPSMRLAPATQRLDKTPELALAVRSTSRVDTGHVRQLYQFRLEGRVRPLIFLSHGLHVVMAVEKQSRSGTAFSIAGMGQNQWVAFGGNHMGFESHAREFVLQPAGSFGDPLPYPTDRWILKVSSAAR